MRAFLPALVVVATACGGRDPSVPQAGTASATSSVSPASTEPVSGRHTFVIVAEESRASYIAEEEFFAGALKKLGIAAGKRKVFGSTQAISGQFELDPGRPAAGLGKNTFSVRMNTFTTEQSRRDTYIREDGPRFNDYPLATFDATAVDDAARASGRGDHAGNAESALHVKLSGKLTIREIAKPVVFDVTAKLAGNTLAGTATTRLRMSDFGIEPLDFYNTLTVADEFGIEVRFTARARTEAEPVR